MKHFLTLAILFGSILNLNAQSERPRALTPQILAGIKTEVNNEALAYNAKLKTNKDLTAEQILFSTDTFRINHTSLRRMEVDYSTAGMNETVNTTTAAYDVLLNKYYNKVLNQLKAADKTVLIKAQRAWITYRDAEAKMIWTMARKEYSGGGSMQSNIATASYGTLVVNRTLEIYGYYQTLISSK